MSDRYQNLFRNIPEKDGIQEGLLLSIKKLGELYYLQKDFQNAMIVFARLNALTDSLYQNDLQNNDLYIALGESYYTLADVQIILNLLQDAIINLERAGVIYLKLAEKLEDESYQKFYNSKIKPEIDRIKK